MFGDLLGNVIDIATTPVRLGNSLLDQVTGGSGKEKSRKEIPVSGNAEELLDELIRRLKRKGY